MAASTGLLLANMPSIAAEDRREAKPIQQAAQTETSQKTTDATVSLVTDSVDLREAPFREALQLLFAANNRPFAIDVKVGNYDTTLSYAGLPLAESLQAYNEKGPSAFTYVVESGVCIVKPVKGSGDMPIAKETTEVRYGENKTHRKDKKERDVIRRVSGLLRHEERRNPDAAPIVTYFALLETTYFVGDDKDTSVRIVIDGSMIESGRANSPKVRVVKVDAKGVTLQPSGEKPFVVPLAPLPAVQK